VPSTHRRLTAAFALVLLGGLSYPRAQAPATLPDETAIEKFLREGKVVATRAAGKGITGSIRATLSDGTLTHDAQIQTVDESKAVFTTPKGIERDFRDSWEYNVAAYRVSKLIDLRMVPVSVERTWNSKRGAFTWWVDNVAMDEQTRDEKKIEAPNQACWTEAVLMIRVFDALIDNTDRNQGNTLYTKDWRVWAIDHTRAFRRSREPKSFVSMPRIDRGVLQRMEALTLPMLKKEIGRFLIDGDLRLLLSRRDALVKHFRSRGEAALFDRQPPEKGCL
jgi:hypothetical protein